jgi:hypothetical protein
MDHRNSPSFDDLKQNNKDSFIFGAVESKDSYIDISKDISSQTLRHNKNVPRIPDIPKTPNKDLLIKSAREADPMRFHPDLGQTNEDQYQLQIITLKRTVENLNLTVSQKETYIGILERKFRQQLSGQKDLGLLSQFEERESLIIERDLLEKSQSSKRITKERINYSFKTDIERDSSEVEARVSEFDPERPQSVPMGGDDALLSEVYGNLLGKDRD